MADNQQVSEEAVSANGGAEAHDDRSHKPKKQQRSLIIIGGHEDKEDKKIILREVARRVGSGKLVVTTVASHEPEGYFEAYEKVFHELGVKDLALLEIAQRNDAMDEAKLRLLEGATGVFFTGGDQLKITSQIGDTPIYWRIKEIYEAGGVIAGTSAGASAMSHTMLVRGVSSGTHRVGEDTLNMAPGLGFIDGVIIDQHFAERGRMSRLLAAVAHNPHMLGLGIDEDTAIVIEEGHAFQVLGSGAVYVVDGKGITYSNIAEDEEDQALSMFNVKLHVLSTGNQFYLSDHSPIET